MSNAREVRYEWLRPRDVVAAREACPIAYLPLGSLEWHGFHSPVGTDGIKAHALAVRCAQADGGLVFPTLFYGESRDEGLMDSGAADQTEIHREMRLPDANFAPGYMRFTPEQQYENYQRLLLHCLCEIQSLGFKVMVVLCGHYPLFDHARATCSHFHQCRWQGRRAHSIAWATAGEDIVEDQFDTVFDHSGIQETSCMMALLPGTIDLSQQPQDPSAKLVGVLSKRPVQESSVEFGEKAVSLMVQRITAQARDRLEHPDKYYGHGLRFETH